MYRPLPNGITIGKSGIDGLGVVATKEFKANTVLGIVHIANKNFPHGYIRTALGAFYNHSETPNCVILNGFWHQIPVMNRVLQHLQRSCSIFFVVEVVNCQINQS